MASFLSSHDNAPRTDEPELHEEMERGKGALKVLVTLAGATAGLYVAFTTPNGIVYVGGLAGMYGFYKAFSVLTRLGRHWGAKSYEIVEVPPKQ